MRNKSLLHAAVALVVLLAGTSLYAQSYSNAVYALNPAGYWPLTESASPAPVSIATNSGTAGAACQGYYMSWYQPMSGSAAMRATNNIVHLPGVTPDGDLAMQEYVVGQSVIIPRATNGVANPAASIKPPFSVEIWVHGTNTAATGSTKALVNQGSTKAAQGWVLGNYNANFYFACYDVTGTKKEIAINNCLSNDWQHIVATFDGTLQALYVNGRKMTGTLTAGYSPDTASPLLIGTSASQNNMFGGLFDEVAIYTNVLTDQQVTNHMWAVTTNAPADYYTSLIQAEHPLIYLRLNDTPASAPAVADCPVANNYGTLGAAAKGYYLPGAIPGVAGPAYAGLGAASKAVALNGVNGVIDVGNGSLPAEFNPTNHQPVSVAAWVKGNPADSLVRPQRVLSHGGNNTPRIVWDGGGQHFNPGAGPDLAFGSADQAATGIFPNDNQWHLTVGVYDGTTASLYLDGVLVKSATGAGNIVGTNLDLILGGDPLYMSPAVSWDNGSALFPFAGSLAHVAVFTNALSAAEVQSLVNAAGVLPVIQTQPLPAGQTVYNGQSATIGAPTMTALSSQPMTYQWYKGTPGSGVLLAGKSSPSYSIASATSADSGSYYVVVTNPYGSATSAVCTVTVSATSAYPYANTIKALNPAGYWPLDESAQPPMPFSLVVSNSGTLGTNGTGFYGAWYQPAGTTWYITNNIVFSNSTAFALGGKALGCQASPGQYVVIPRSTNGVANPAATINAPFSVETWAYVANTNGNNKILVSQGQVPVSVNGSDPTNPFYNGTTNGWAGFALGQYQDYFYFLIMSTNYPGSKAGAIQTSTYNAYKGFAPGQWIHVVATFDGTTSVIYTNGVKANQLTVPKNAAGLTYVPDPTTPLMIASGGDVSVSTAVQNLSPYAGALDEVAIYPVALDATAVQNHFNAAKNTGYAAAILADSPSYYFRFDADTIAPVNAGYNSSTFPTAANYGTLGGAANGVYQPGTFPGAAGPAFGGFGGSKAVAINGFFGAVDVGGGNLPAALNPASNAPMSIVSWFQTGPADAPARWNDIVGRGTNSYRLELDINSGGPTFTPGQGSGGGQAQFANPGELHASTFTCNDGKWHMIAGTYDGGSTVMMYLDGVVAKSNYIPGKLSFPGTNTDLLLGGSSAYTYADTANANTIRTFDGQIAQVAFFTNALSPAQIQQIYGAAGVPPTIVTQPPATVPANSGDNISIPVVARGSALSYQWYRTNADGTTPAASGQTAANLTFNPIQLADAGSYFAIITNNWGAVTSSVVSLTVVGPPVVTAQSLPDIKVFKETTPILRATVTGPAPLSFQWKSNNVVIAGATSSNYIPSTATSGISTYTCVITNSYSANQPSAFTPITVQVLDKPTAPYPLQVLADKPIAYWRLNEADSVTTTAYDYAGGYNGGYSNTFQQYPYIDRGYSPETEPTELPPAFGYNIPPLDSYIANVPSYVNFATPAGSSAQFSVEAWVRADYGVTVDAGIVAVGYGWGGDQFGLDCGGADNKQLPHCYRFYVHDANGKSYNAISTNTAPGDGVWHHLVGVCDQRNGKISLIIDGQVQASSSIPTTAGLFPLTVPLTIGSRMFNGASTHFDNQFQGFINDVTLYTNALSLTQVQNHYVAAGRPPIIVQAPANVTTNENQNVAFTVSAIGSGTLSYQWQDNNDQVIPGATGPTLVLSSVKANQAGTYTVTVGNAYGTATTNATLTVNSGGPTLAVDLQPPFHADYAGQPFTYTVVAQGSTPFTYVWKCNGNVIPGVTGSSYALTTLAGTNTYMVKVSNAANPAGVNSATVTNVGVQFTTLDPATYNNSLTVSFTGFNRSTSLSNFPALVRLSTARSGFNYSQFQPNGADLRFTDASGTHLIPHEIDEWNPDGESTVWVRVPSLAHNTNSIIAYWGNANAAAPKAYGTVWQADIDPVADFQVVYHLKEGAMPFVDSTGQHTTSSGVAPGLSTGAIGNAGAFTGSQYLDLGPVNLGDVFTLSAWVYFPAGTYSQQTLWANKKGGYVEPGFAMFFNSYNAADNRIDFATANDAGGMESKTPANSVSTSAWHLLTVAVNRTNGTAQAYVDDASAALTPAPVTNFPNSMTLNLGRLTNSGAYFNGTMDEARIQTGMSSADWVWASYMTVAANPTFQNYAAVISAGPVLLNAQVVQVSGLPYLHLSWTQQNYLLQAAPTPMGTWHDVPAGSPYETPMSGAQQYFRLRKGP